MTASSGPVRHVRPDGGRRPRARRSAASTVAGVLGEVLITVGVLLGLFVVWQLWWTDVQGAREQAEVLQSMGWEVPADEAVEVRRDEPPVAEQPAVGDVFGQLFVPRWDDAVIPLAQGTDKRTILDKAMAGHYPETVMPGAIGNFSLAAHRMTYGAPFHRVEELEVGDPLVVRSNDTWYVYRVTEGFVVQPSQVEVIAPVPGQPGVEPTQRFLTLTTCHPIGLNSLRERFIVHAELDYWLPVADGLPPDLVGHVPDELVAAPPEAAEGADGAAPAGLAGARAVDTVTGPTNGGR
ncbi:class E sortase [Oerskovia sp. NPDC056781]|uniref:class E sortase n=1 Tax=Oerskovia sp. NPDC056781 TaxID=3345942 RepID=UPI00366CF1CF